MENIYSRTLKIVVAELRQGSWEPGMVATGMVCMAATVLQRLHQSTAKELFHSPGGQHQFSKVTLDQR